METEWLAELGMKGEVFHEVKVERAGLRGVADVVVRDLKKGAKQVRWRYQTGSGKEVSVELPLAVFRPTLETMEKMLAEMGAMKQMGK
jgi:hypothetical protein